MLVFYFEVLLNMLQFYFDACCYFFNIRPAMFSNHSKLVKRQVRDRYGRFASPSSYIAPPSSRQEVGSSSYHRTAPPLSR
jgi:hypothetical protein